jgi:hypothetical protein
MNNKRRQIATPFQASHGKYTAPVPGGIEPVRVVPFLAVPEAEICVHNGKQTPMTTSHTRARSQKLRDDIAESVCMADRSPSE